MNLPGGLFEPAHVLDVLSAPVWQHLALALLHTLWQGALVAAVLVLLLARLGADRPLARYLASCAALAAIVVAGVATWSIQDVTHARRVVAQREAAASAAESTRAPRTALHQHVDAAPAVDTASSLTPQSSTARSSAAPSSAAPSSPATRFPVASATPVTAARDEGRATAGVTAWLSDGTSKLLDRAQVLDRALPALTVAWLAGVVLMLARLAWQVTAARALLRGAPISDERWLAWRDELCAALGITRTVRLLELPASGRFAPGGRWGWSRRAATPAFWGPAAWGVVRPVVLLPLAALTGLSPEVLRAILAHELAHVRRHDYLVNLAQMAIEALLFFNPAVWWINRQIRAEREACCDRLAADVTGQPWTVPEALYEWAVRMAELGQQDERAPSVASVAPAWSGRASSRWPLVDRARRLLVKGYRPRPLVSPLGLSVWLLVTMLALVALWRSTTAVVALAADVLSPAERVEQVERTRQEYATGDNVRVGRGTLRGTLRTADEEPLPGDIRGSSYSRRRDSSMIASLGTLGENIEISVQSGRVWLLLDAPGYAPAIVGPYTVQADETIEAIDVVLQRGFPLELRVSDRGGQPIAGATLQANPIIDGASSGFRQFETDEQGIVRIEHAIEGAYRVTARRHGFQPLRGQEFDVARERPIEITLQPARVVPGTVRSRDGRPLAGVEVVQFARWVDEGASEQHGRGGTVLATSDAEGRFLLDELVPRVVYNLLLVSPGEGRAFAEVTDEVERLDVELPGNLSVSGTLLGAPTDRTERLRMGALSVSYSQQVELAGWGTRRATYRDADRVQLDISGQVPCFTIDGLLPGEVLLRFGEYAVRTEVGLASPHAEVTIDLSAPAPQPAQRTVILRLEGFDPTAPPQGTVSTYARGEASGGDTRDLPVEGGSVRIDVATPSHLHYYARGLVGYWFARGNFEVPPGDEPLEVAVSLFPAGAVAGQVVTADGSPPAEGATVDLRVLQAPTPIERHQVHSGAHYNLDERGRFVFTPLPLGGQYQLAAADGRNVVVSPAISLDESRPTVALELSLPETTSVAGSIVDAGGRPLADFGFHLHYQDAHSEYTRSWSMTTDARGQFAIDDLAADRAQYAIRVLPRSRFQPRLVPLQAAAPAPLTIRLEDGLVAEGQILDADSLWPVPGVGLSAIPVDPRPGGVIVYEAEAVTDRDGRFRFSNLGPRVYRLYSRSGTQWSDDDEALLHPGEPARLIYVTLSPMSDVVPRRPEVEP